MTAARPRTGRARSKSFILIVRRLHLFAGLFLSPWILIYAVSAFLLNHPTAFPDQEGTAFGTGDVAATPLAALRPPEEIATDVVAELNRRTGRERYRVVEPDRAQYRGEFASAVLRTGDKSYAVFVDVRDGTGFARLRDEPKSPAPFSPGPVKLPTATVAGQLQEGLPTALTRAGLPPGEVTVTFVPDVLFQIVDVDGGSWRAVYSPLNGSLNGSPGETNAVTTRRYLTRLHVTRGYPPSPGVRWFWALSVDIVSVAMAFWIATGLVMWWQLRAVRRTGLFVMLLSAAAAAWLAFGMHSQFTR